MATTLKWAIALLISIACLFFASGFEIQEDALDLLPGEAFRGDFELLQRMGLIDRIFISLEITPGNHPSQEEAAIALKQSAENVGKALQKSTHFSKVFYRLPQEVSTGYFTWFKEATPALITEEELAMIEPKLQGEGLRQTLFENFLLLNSIAGLPMKEKIRLDPFGLFDVLPMRLEELRGQFSVKINDGFFTSSEGNSCLLWAESGLPLTDSKNAEKIQAMLDNILDKNVSSGISVRIIGSLPHTLANARIIQSDLKKLVPVAVGVLLLLFILVMRSWRALFVVGIPFLAAPVAISVVLAMYSKVSAMALGFGIVLLGISVDFAIHLYLALSREQGSRAEIMRGVARPIFLATCTTVGVFVILLFSEVPSHRQMAMLAISGIVFAVALSWLLVPTLVKKHYFERLPMSGSRGNISTFGAFSKMIIFILWMALVAGGFYSWPHLKYNGDLKKLDVGDQKIEEDEAYFFSTWKKPGDESFVVAKGRNLAEALNKNDLIYEQLAAGGIKGVQSVAPVFPGPQKKEENIKRWTAFWGNRMEALTNDLETVGEEIGFSNIAFLPFLQWISTADNEVGNDFFFQGPLQPMLISLIRENGPKQIKSVSQNDGTLVATVVPETAASKKVLEKIESVIPGVKVLSNSKWRVQVEDMMRRDIVRLSLAAAVFTALLMFVFFRKPRIVAAVLAPVVSALSAMAIFDYLTAKDLNLMHVLMGIMVIGLSVDYGIFMVNAFERRVTKSTMLAVSVCAASTLSGFGVLSFAVHPALHSLGVTVLAGIGAAWPTALFVTPIFLKKKEALL